MADKPKGDPRNVTHHRVYIEKELIRELKRKANSKRRIPYTVLVEAALETYLGKRA